MRLVPEVKMLSKFLPIRWSSKQTATWTETLQIHVKKSPIVYDLETKVLYRKSGNAAYQTLIESIYDLKFEIAQAPPQTCIKVSVQVIIDPQEQETVLCQLVWCILNDGLVKRLKS